MHVRMYVCILPAASSILMFINGPENESCVCGCMHVCMYVCMHARMYVCAYIHTYICILPAASSILMFINGPEKESCAWGCMYVCTYVYTYVCILPAASSILMLINGPEKESCAWGCILFPPVRLGSHEAGISMGRFISVVSVFPLKTGADSRAKCKYISYLYVCMYVCM